MINHTPREKLECCKDGATIGGFSRVNRIFTNTIRAINRRAYEHRRHMQLGDAFQVRNNDWRVEE